MELIGIDKDHNVVCQSINYLNLQWNRKYYDTGDFSIQILQEDYIPSMRYVYSPDRKECGIIEKIQTSTEVKGEFLQLIGRFVEILFSRDVVKPRLAVKGKPSELSLRIVKENIVNFPCDILFDENIDAVLEEEVDIDYFGQEVDDALYPLLKQVEKSYRIVYDYDNKRFVQSIWQGVDRTQDQGENSFALFSDASNTDKIDVVEDESGYKNFAVIAMPENAFIDYDGRSEPSEERRSLFIDCSQSSPEENQSQEDFRSSCIQKAKEELAKHPFIRNVELEAIQENLTYLVDFDLGDKCDVVAHKIQKAYQARIIEVREVHKDNKCTIDLVFGDKIPTHYERMMNR